MLTKLECRSPSNIALIKYWGKYGDQLPSNPSLSFTLKESITKMIISFRPLKEDDKTHFDFLFEGQNSPKFSDKIIKYLEKRKEDLQFLKSYYLKIESINTFPHSAGIASSASSMSCLAFGICLIEKYLKADCNLEKLNLEDDFYEKVSHLSRLGSGSACRSVYSGVVSWGEAKEINSSNTHAAKVSGLHPVFNDFKDTILIVDSKEKAVSSRAGHELMNKHPFKEARFLSARENLIELIKAMKLGDLDRFGEIVEREALELHGLMMNSNPSFILLKPNTLELIEKIRNFRNTHKMPLFFTLDAGPNIHLLYPKKLENNIHKFIKNELVSFLDEGKYIFDEVGTGPGYKFL